MKFDFSFEKLLLHKRTLEDVAKREWVEAQMEADKAMAELNAFYTQIDEARLRAGKIEQSGGQRSAELGMIDEFINGQKIRIERQRSVLRELMAEAERRQELVIEAAKERKTLEKLRERRFEEYRLMRKKLELKRMDELVVTRFQSSDKMTNAKADTKSDAKK